MLQACILLRTTSHTLTLCIWAIDPWCLQILSHGYLIFENVKGHILRQQKGVPVFGYLVEE